MATTAEKVNKYKFPKTIGACADLYYQLRQKRAEAQKAVAAIEAEEKALKEHIINHLPKSEASGVSGKVANVLVTTKDIPQVEDWEAFYKHVIKTKNFAFLQKRLSDAAIKDVWEAGKEVPGVSHFTAVSLSVRKLK